MSRPSFEKITSYEEFSKYYWYYEELQKICKQLNLEYIGNKKELNEIIRAYFKGEQNKHQTKPKIKATTSNLTLDTPLLTCGFTFGAKFKEFFIKQTNDLNFKFNVDMVETVKQVKANHDTTFTLQDLLDVKLNKKQYAKYDKSSCQWNQFLKDFCADSLNQHYQNKLKIASQYWKILRNSEGEKVYSQEFIKANQDKIKEDNS